MKILHKLIFLISLFAVSLVAVGLVSSNSLTKTATGSEIIYKEQLLPTQYFSNISVNNRAINAYLLELLVTTDKERNQWLSTRIDETIAETENYYKQLDELNLNDDYQQQLNALEQISTELNKARSQVRDLAMQNKNEEGYALFIAEIESKRTTMNAIFDKIEDMSQTNGKAVYEKSKKSADNTIKFVMVVTLISLVLTILIGLVIARLITKPINEIKELFRQAENGDFSVEGKYHSKDEIGMLNESFNMLIGGVKGIITTIGLTSEQVAASSEELSASAEQSTKASEYISTTIQDLAVGAEQQVDSVDESTIVITTISTNTDHIFANTEKVSTTVHQAAKMSSEGRKVIDKVNNQMEFINNRVMSISDSFSTLSNRSKEIEKIIEVITGIAAQTNLLALNAAIEAARAGEHGKGFAVVADEVRKLAEESAQSAEQISKLITHIQNDTDETLKTVNDATAEVKEGRVVVQEAGNTFSQIENVIKEVVPQMSEVTELVKNLIAGTNQVQAVINNVKNVAQETASGTQTVTAATEEQLASMEEIASSSRSLAHLAEDLQCIIKQFKV